MRSIGLALAALFACGTTPKAVEEPAEPAPKPVDRPPEDPGSAAPLPDGMRTYYVVLLRRGPAWSGEDTKENREIGAAHMAHIGAMASAGKLIVAGPFLGQTDAADLAGIYIFDTPSLAATRALAEADPAVKAGRFVAEYLVWAGASGLRTNYVAPAGDKKEPPCPNSRGFDFWVGSWQVTNPKGTVVGTNRIERAERGCVLVESWRSAKGSTGTSINYVDPVSSEWVQLWVDSSGGVIRLRGGLDGAAMVLAGDYVTAKGKKSALRGRWTPQPDGSVRQHFEESTDGKTWKTWFDGTYRRR